MARLAIVCLVLAILCLGLNAAAGVATGLGWMTVRTHFSLAVPTTIIILAAWTIIVFYFIGAVAWVDEAIEERGAEERFAAEARKLRAGILPWVIAAAAALSMTYSIGGGADSGAVHWTVHFGAALVSVFLHLVAGYRVVLFVGMMIALQERSVSGGEP